jgi:hypothetical protein
VKPENIASFCFNYNSIRNISITARNESGNASGVQKARSAYLKKRFVKEHTKNIATGYELDSPGSNHGKD